MQVRRPPSKGFSLGLQPGLGVTQAPGRPEAAVPGGVRRLPIHAGCGAQSSAGLEPDSSTAPQRGQLR